MAKRRRKSSSLALGAAGLRMGGGMLKVGGSLSGGRRARTTSRRRPRSAPRRSRSGRAQPGALEALLGLAITAIFAAVVAAAWAAVFVAGIVFDVGRAGYAAVRHREQPGFRATQELRLRFWRLHLQRLLGPPPLEVRTFNELLALTPSEFEAAVATVFRRLGYQRLTVVGKAGDYCVDVQGLDPQGRSTVIQCKRYAPGNRVGSREVQTFVGMATVHHRAERGIFVTTSSFTAQALRVGADSGRVTLVDGGGLARIVGRGQKETRR